MEELEVEGGEIEEVKNRGEIKEKEGKQEKREGAKEERRGGR